MITSALTPTTTPATALTTNLVSKAGNDYLQASASATFDAISLKQRSFLGAIATGDLWVTGNPLKLRELFSMFDEFSPNFEVIEPVKAKVE